MEEEKPDSKAFWLKIGAFIVAIVVSGSVGYFVGFNAAISQQAAVPNPDTLTMQTFYEPKSLDPSAVFALIEQAVLMNTYETLVWYDKGTTDIIPWLAESWSVSSDGLKYTFNLRQGVMFHDGTELTAEAVKFSIDRVILINNPEGTTFLLAPIKGASDYLQGDTWGQTNQSAVDAYLNAGGVRVVDTYTVEINLDFPSAAFIRALAHPIASIVSPTAVEANGGVVPGFRNEWMDLNIVGTGPFMLASFEPGERVILERFDQYWRGPANLRQVIMEVVAEVTTRELALLTGEADIVFVPTTNAFDLIDQDAWLNNEQIVPTKEGIRVETGPVFFTQQLMLNKNFAPFDDPHFREGLAYVFPYDELIKSVVNGFGTRYSGPVPNGMWAYDEDIFMYDYDPEEAKVHFQESGFQGSIDIWFNTGNEFKRRASLLIKDEVEKLDIGIEVNIIEVVWTQFIESLLAGDVSAFFENFGSTTGDPDEFVTFYGHSQLGGYARLVGYDDPELDALIEEAASETDLERRAGLYHEIQVRMVQDGLYVWLYQEVGFAVMRDWVKGFYWSPVFGSIWGIGGFYYYDLQKSA
jgi:peptide/nickel transport system substrate-binding protein